MYKASFNHRQVVFLVKENPLTMLSSFLNQLPFHSYAAVFKKTVSFHSGWVFKKIFLLNLKPVKGVRGPYVHCLGRLYNSLLSHCADQPL